MCEIYTWGILFCWFIELILYIFYYRKITVWYFWSTDETRRTPSEDAPSLWITLSALFKAALWPFYSLKYPVICLKLIKKKIDKE